MGIFSAIGDVIGSVFGGPVGGLAGDGIGSLLDGSLDDGSISGASYGSIPASSSYDYATMFPGAALDAAAQGLTPYASAYAAYQGQQSANQANIQIAKDAESFSADQAQKNRDFQTQMSNTSYQRAVGDMTAAGLNPMLAYGQGGASTPSGSTAAGIPAHVESAVSPALQSGLQAATLAQQLKKTDAETRLIESQIPRTEAETTATFWSGQKAGQDAAYMAGRVEMLQAEYEKLRAEYRKINSEQERAQFETDHLLPAQRNLVQAETKLRVLEQPGAQNRASAEGSAYSQTLRPYVKDVTGIGGAVGSAALVPLLLR